MPVARPLSDALPAVLADRVFLHKEHLRRQGLWDAVKLNEGGVKSKRAPSAIRLVILYCFAPGICHNAFIT